MNTHVEVEFDVRRLSFPGDVRILVTHSQKGQQMATDQKVGVQLPLKWNYPPELVTHFVDNMVIQFAPAEDPDHFILSFFQVEHPPIIGETQLSSIINKEVNANCIARVVVTPKKMKDFLSVLNRHFEKYEALVKAKK